jgi:hypothetical protein
MRSFVRNSVLALALVTVASAAQAQDRREKELRIDLVGLQSVDGTTVLDIGLPGTVALGIYMNNKIAIEPMVNFLSISGDGNSANQLSVGVFVPYYFKGDTGRNGLFLSPGLLYSKIGGDNPQDGTVDFGVDVGLKKSMRDNVSMRFAVGVRTGDSYEDINGDSQIGIAAAFGIGVFWK